MVLHHLGEVEVSQDQVAVLVDDQVFRLQVAMDDSEVVDGLDCKHQVGKVHFGVFFFEVGLSVEEGPEVAATGKVEDEAVEVTLSKRVVEFDIVPTFNAPVDPHLLLESCQSILTKVACL